MPVLAGDDVLASDIWRTRYVYKSASEAVTSSTVLQNDNELFIALPLGQFRVETFLSVTGQNSTTLGGISMAWTNTGTMTGLTRACMGPAFGAIAQTTANLGADSSRWTTHGLTTPVAYGGLGTATAIVHEDLLVDVTIAGTLTLQWAQRASTGTATNVGVGSRLMVTQVEAV